jgi:hypothetical protein
MDTTDWVGWDAALNLPCSIVANDNERRCRDRVETGNAETLSPSWSRNR